MKKNLLAFGVGVLASICLISLYAFQTENQEQEKDIVIMRFNNGLLNISSGVENFKSVKIGPLSVISMPENQQRLNDVLNEYQLKVYHIANSVSLREGNFTFILEKE